jgi:replication factor C subunit 2/4
MTLACDSKKMQESHSRITRFILICNYVTRIIEPLASRCAKFRFQSLPPESMKARLTEIAHAEGCNDTVTAVVDDILQYAGGDMRRAVTTLQSVHSTGLAGSGDTVDAIAELAGLPPAGVVNELWASMNQPKFAIMQAAVDDACAAGFSAQLLVAALLDKILAPDCGLNELSLAEIAIRIAEAEKNMTEGADEYLQFMTVATLVLTCFQKSERELNQPTAMVTN